MQAIEGRKSRVVAAQSRLTTNRVESTPHIRNAQNKTPILDSRTHFSSLLFRLVSKKSNRARDMCFPYRERQTFFATVSSLFERDAILDSRRGSRYDGARITKTILKRVFQCATHDATRAPRRFFLSARAPSLVSHRCSARLASRVSRDLSGRRKRSVPSERKTLSSATRIYWLERIDPFDASSPSFRRARSRAPAKCPVSRRADRPAAHQNPLRPRPIAFLSTFPLIRTTT